MHVLKDAGATFAEAVFPDQARAEKYAGARSTDIGVRGTAVTRFTVGELGTRSTINWFVDDASCDGRILAARSRRRAVVEG
ncbi:hypothetical protein [Pseudonocardia humida]|uniref:Uncharacterized protein n=1 Tax=Pseudonocardia humida TaxID=2800819 RepID=A0ABT1A5J2_9PSEU|nr:hypothetical protein [Pseudonocardia humida]MCO1658269.1 hypothetical protein [Pseudonocardia humida]